MFHNIIVGIKPNTNMPEKIHIKTILMCSLSIFDIDILQFGLMRGQTARGIIVNMSKDKNEKSLSNSAKRKKFNKKIHIEQI
jgi:hypothetical protein